MTDSTAAWAAAVAAAVAALTIVFCTLAALDFAAPTIVRWVLRAKLVLAMEISSGTVDDNATRVPPFRSRNRIHPYIAPCCLVTRVAGQSTRLPLSFIRAIQSSHSRPRPD